MEKQELDISNEAMEISNIHQGNLALAIASARCRGLPPHLEKELIDLIQRIFNERIPKTDEKSINEPEQDQEVMEDPKTDDLVMEDPKTDDLVMEDPDIRRVNSRP